MSTTAGLHVPVMPLVDVVGKMGTVPPAQIDKAVPKLNAGVMLGFTVTVNVTDVAHTPPAGVNVYTPEFRLSTVAGLHVPLTPLVEVAGSDGTAPPAHIVSELPKLKAGVVFGVTVSVNVVGLAHCPAAGVNV